MRQELKSERSRRHILDSALFLFSHFGYGATSVRDIATRSHLSTGNVYHHFPDKEAIYKTLFDEYWTAVSDPRLPFNVALATGTFPDNLELIGFAAERLVREHRQYIALIYVDVVEFDGQHIRRFYDDMARRFEKFLATHGGKDIEQRLRPGISPVSAVMLASRFFLNYFSIEIVFGVKDHFGKASDELVREAADMLRHGMVRPAGSRAVVKPKAKSRRPAKKAAAPRSSRH